MKKSTKRWCIAAVVLMVIGGIMAISAVHFGAATLISWVNGEFKIGQETTILEKSPVEEFQNIELDLQSSNIELIASDDYYIEFDECAGVLEYKVKDDTLIIEQKEKSVFMSIGFGFSKNRENTVRLYYPEETVLNNISMEVDMGYLYFSEVRASLMELNCDMGSVELEKCFAGELIIEADMGSVNLEEVSVDKIDVKADMGNVEISKIDIMEKGIVTCNMGNVEMSFEKPVETYEIYAKIDMGDLLVDDEKCGSTYKSKGEIPLEITNDMGDIELNFAK
ncbi:MAG: DUF4097 family beta strand repeat protein [Lachnospiraceae bacterium]|nr:DUF4097 family beta strand repeat protein [Lachnospiraceae bacterium]